jgi:hypothetical protein
MEIWKLLLTIFKDARGSTSLIVIGCTAWTTYQIRQIDSQSWTVHMQAVWADQVSQHNPTNWVPNPYSIFWAEKHGERQKAQRVMQ